MLTYLCSHTDNFYLKVRSRPPTTMDPLGRRTCGGEVALVSTAQPSSNANNQIDMEFTRLRHSRRTPDAVQTNFEYFPTSSFSYGLGSQTFDAVQTELRVQHYIKLLLRPAMPNLRCSANRVPSKSIHQAFHTARDVS